MASAPSLLLTLLRRLEDERAMRRHLREVEKDVEELTVHRIALRRQHDKEGDRECKSTIERDSRNDEGEECE